MDGKILPAHVDAGYERQGWGRGLPKARIDKNTVKRIDYCMDAITEEKESGET
jgi:hypothetical protein